MKMLGALGMNGNIKIEHLHVEFQHKIRYDIFDASNGHAATKVP